MTSGGAVRVRVPATSANLGPGFDSFGLALAHHDEVTAEITGSGLAVEVAGEGAANVPRDERHLVVRAMRVAFDRLGGQPAGLRLRCRNTIPHGRGLGSSAAAICAGVVAARALVDDGAARLDDAALLALAAEIEGHPDNVAACLLGGFTVAWRGSAGRDEALRLTPAPDVAAVVFVPAGALSTEVARGLLPERVPHADAAHTAARAGLLTAALTSTAPEVAGRRDALLLDATDDRLHQPYRAAAMPATIALIGQLRDGGVAAVVSGAGPSVLALGTAGRLAALDPPADGWTTRRVALDTVGTVATVGTAGTFGTFGTFGTDAFSSIPAFMGLTSENVVE